MMTPNYHNRIESFKSKMIEAEIDAAIISKKENIAYLSGFTSLHPTEREAYLFITPKEVVLYHSPFIDPSAATERSVIAISMSAKQTMSHIFRQYISNINSFGIEKLDLTVAELDRTQSLMPNTVSIEAVDSILQELRQLKDQYELAQIKSACKITTTTFNWIKTYIYSKQAIGITEKDLAFKIEQKLRELGADGLAFPTIVAFDTHSASPHHIPTNSKLHSKSIVLVDMGCEINGYKSDMTRTWCIAAAPPQQFLKIEKIVMEAYTSAASLVGASQPAGGSPLHASDIDSTARNIINNSGYGEKFIHTTGHGIGLEAHEPPSINISNQELLKSRMVITIEPGIYIPGLYGYRHEDTFILD